ncbi:MAG: DUF308 domain-containing protein [Planctomycetota bacterium]|nr:DUF308 domain-containing protein [Planctomycetota bacterium]
MSQAADALKQGGKSVSIIGWVCTILGVLAIVFPFAAGTGVTLAIGLTLLLAGIARTLGGWRRRGRDGLGPVLLGALTGIAGLLFLCEPWFGLQVLTAILIAYFLMSGVLTLLAAFKLRPAAGWGWFAFDGAVSLVLGGVLWSQYPVSAIWLIGVLVGVRLLFMGLVMIATGRAVREVAGLAR